MDLSLTSITCVGQDNQNDNAYSLFLTTATGNVLEYRHPIHSGTSFTTIFIRTEQTWNGIRADCAESRRKLGNFFTCIQNKNEVNIC